MRDKLDWNDLRYVLAIARRGTLAGAAEALGVNHSTVFRRLNALEQRLGVRVFERLSEGYVLTAEGEEIRHHAEAMDETVNALARRVAGKDFRLSGRIRLTTAPNLAVEYVAQYLVDFQQRYPEIQVEIATGDHDFDLGRREADIALRATSNPPEFLVGRRVLSLHWHACAGAPYLARHGQPSALEELSAHKLIGADDDFTRLPVFAWQRRSYPSSAFAVRASDLSTMRALAVAGAGVAFLPSDQLGAGLTTLFALPREFSAALWLLTHPDLRHVARIKAFMEYLFERLRADPRLRDSVDDEIAPSTKRRRKVRR